MLSKKYLDKARKLTPTGSDYALAKLLGITESAVNHYTNERRVIDNYCALRLAELLNKPLAEIIAASNYDRETDETKKERWHLLLKKCASLSKKASVITALCIVLAPGAQLSKSNAANESDLTSVPIIRNRRRTA